MLFKVAGYKNQLLHDSDKSVHPLTWADPEEGTGGPDSLEYHMCQ